MQRARRGGVGSPKGNRWRNAKHNANAPAPRESRIGKAFERRADTPNAAPRARRRAERSEGTPIALQSPVGLARGASNDQAGTNTGMILARVSTDL